MSLTLEPSSAAAPSASSAEQNSGLWTTLREAVRGSAIDYTTAPIGRAVIMLAVPMVMEMAMESIFAVADVFWVAHLGANAVATVGLTESMLTMIYTAAMGLSIGATALVARRIGEQDADGASRAAAQSILLGVIVAAAIAVLAAPRAADAAARDGRVARGDQLGAPVHARHARRQRHRGAAVPASTRCSAGRATRRSRCACCGSATC